MVPSDADQGFKVTDRRRRSDDDELAPTPMARAETRPVEPQRPEPTRPSIREADTQLPPPDAEKDLTGLFVMLASSAAMALGEAPDPMTGQVHRDLDQAAELIDLLVLLRQKTEGHRIPEESQVLDEVIYDLQVRYVAAMRPSAPPPGPSRS
jgi:uncharacterized protein DUF1844